MMEQFAIGIGGEADEATRLALVADLDVIAETYRESITHFTVSSMPAPVVASLRRLTAEEERLEEERLEEELAQSEEIPANGHDPS